MKKTKYIYFFRNFYINVNSTLFGIILISKKHLLWGFSKWPPFKQSVPGLNRDMSLNFYWLRSANHMKSIDKCVKGMKKHVLAKKKQTFTNGLNMGLPKQELKRKSMKGKHTDSQVKKIFWMPQLVKVMLAIWKHLLLDFL